MEPQNKITPQPDEQPTGEAATEVPAPVEQTAPASPEATAQAPEAAKSDTVNPESSNDPVTDGSIDPPTETNSTPDEPASDSEASPSSVTETPQAPSAPQTNPTESTPAPTGAVVGGANQSPTPVVSTVSKGGGGGKRKILLLAVVVLLVLLLGGGYVFAIYLPNRPGEVYAKSLTNTGAAVDALVNYSGTVENKNYKSYDVNSTLHVTGTASFDASLTGAIDTSGDSTFKANADVLGEQVNANVESVHVPGSATPDVYLQLSGISKELNSLGLSSLDNLDGKWISVDHTIISSVLAELNQGASNATKSSVIPTAAEIHDAETKVQSVNKQYIFTTAASDAVLMNEKYLGEETVSGRNTYHYLVGYNKPHLEAYIGALGTALDTSSLNSWSKTANNGQELSQELGLPSLLKSVEKANSSTTFDVWVDTKTKLIDSVQFVDPSDKTSTFTISQDYTGGSSYPLSFQFAGKDPSSGSTEKTSLNLTVNTMSNAYTGTFNSSEGSTGATFGFVLTPSSKTVNVTAPVGAESIDDVLAQLGVSDSSDSL